MNLRAETTPQNLKKPHQPCKKPSKNSLKIVALQIMIQLRGILGRVICPLFHDVQYKFHHFKCKIHHIKMQKSSFSNAKLIIFNAKSIVSGSYLRVRIYIRHP